MTLPRRPASPLTAIGVVVITTLWAGAVLTTVKAEPSGPAGGSTTTVPTGSVLQLNSYTTGQQAFPSIAALPSGDFVVVWQSDGSPGDDIGGAVSGTSVQLRRTDASGVPLGTDLQVNTWTFFDQTFPSATVLASGDVLVTWRSWFVDAGDSQPTRTARARLFESTGLPLGDEFQLETTTGDDQTGPVAGAKGDGGFVVAWQSRSSSGGDDSSWSIQARRFGSGGAPLGDDFQVNTEEVGAQFGPALTMRRGDRFSVVWISEVDLRGRSFDADGTPSGPDFLVAENPDPSNITLVLRGVFAETSDRLLVFYEVGPNPIVFPIDIDLRARRFTAGGDPIGGEIHFEVDDPADRDLNDVVQLINGDFLVVWTRNLLADGPNSVWTQRFDASGVPRGPSVVLSDVGTPRRLAAAVGVGDGTALAAWVFDGPLSWDIRGRPINVPPTAGIFADGFESGDVDAWE